MYLANLHLLKFHNTRPTTGQWHEKAENLLSPPRPLGTAPSEPWLSRTLKIPRPPWAHSPQTCSSTLRPERSKQEETLISIPYHFYKSIWNQSTISQAFTALFWIISSLINWFPQWQPNGMQDTILCIFYQHKKSAFRIISAITITHCQEEPYRSDRHNSEGSRDANEQTPCQLDFPLTIFHNGQPDVTPRHRRSSYTPRKRFEGSSFLGDM